MLGRERPLARIGRAQHAAPQGGEGASDLPVEVPLQGALSVPIDQIFPDPEQPRREFDPVKLRELADSLKEHKQIQPVIVREAGTLPDGRTRYILIVGGRRRAAAALAALKTLDVVVRGSSDSTEAARAEQRAKDWLVQLAENMHREDVNPVREAEVYRAYMALTGKSAVKLAGDLGCGHTRVSNRLKLLEDRDVSDAVLAGRISYTVGNQLMRVMDPEQRAALLTRATAEALTEDQVRSLRARNARDEDDAPLSPVRGDGSAAAERADRDEMGWRGDDGSGAPNAHTLAGAPHDPDLSIVPRPRPLPDDAARAVHALAAAYGVAEDDAVVARAVAALGEEPDLTPHEALGAAMAADPAHAEAFAARSLAPFAAPNAGTRANVPTGQPSRDGGGRGAAAGTPRTLPQAEFISRLYSVGPTGPLLDLLDWALNARLDLAGLRRRVAAEAENLRDTLDEDVGRA